MTTLSFDDPASVVASCEALCYYFNLRLMEKKHGKEVKVPEALNQIIELAQNLPKPQIADWSVLANGKLPAGKASKAKAASANKTSGEGAAAGENGEKKTRGQWTDETKQELVELVDSEEKRKELFGTSSVFIDVFIILLDDYVERSIQ